MEERLIEVPCQKVFSWALSSFSARVTSEEDRGTESEDNGSERKARWACDERGDLCDRRLTRGRRHDDCELPLRVPGCWQTRAATQQAGVSDASGEGMREFMEIRCGLPWAGPMMVNMGQGPNVFWWGCPRSLLPQEQERARGAGRLRSISTILPPPGNRKEKDTKSSRLSTLSQQCPSISPTLRTPVCSSRATTSESLRYRDPSMRARAADRTSLLPTATTRKMAPCCETLTHAAPLPRQSRRPSAHTVATRSSSTICKR